jgi:hypothetical protein
MVPAGFVFLQAICLRIDSINSVPNTNSPIKNSVFNSVVILHAMV